MSTATIRAFFETTLKTWADAQTPKVPIAFENVSFTKPTSGTFLECFLLPAGTINPSVDGSTKREVGLFQVNCWVQQGTGSKSATSLAQSVVDLFPIVPKTNVVSIEKTPRIERAILDNSGWFIIPVVITYRYETV